MMDANSSSQERQNMFNLSKREKENEKKKIYLENCNLQIINKRVNINNHNRVRNFQNILSAKDFLYQLQHK